MTDGGRTAYEKGRQIKDQAERELFGALTASETSTLHTLLAKLKPLIKPPGFTGRAPGGPSRWSTERSAEWEPLAPKLVVEVSYDHFKGDRFRHATRFLHWRPDKAPRKCTLEQVADSTREPGLPGSAAARRPGRGGGSRQIASSTSRRSSGARKRAGRPPATLPEGKVDGRPDPEKYEGPEPRER